jgi:hypothetical protein
MTLKALKLPPAFACNGFEAGLTDVPESSRAFCTLPKGSTSTVLILKLAKRDADACVTAVNAVLSRARFIC